MGPRRRLDRPLRLRGHALFNGGPASVSLIPGIPGAGWRWAVGNGPFEALHPEQRTALPRRSALDGLHRAELCEHVLAALLLADIDDCDLRFHDGEAPILDGSARPWLLAIRQAGVSGKRRSTHLRVGILWAGQELLWTTELDRLKEGQIGGERLGVARTFIHQHEGAALRDSGRFRGARPGCAVVLADRGSSAIYGGRPRLRNEPLGHKLLDLLGDLAPWRARGRLHGELQVENPGHATNGRAIAAALADGRLTLAP